MKKIIATMAALLLTVTGLNACTLKSEKQEHSNMEATSLAGKKVLVAYFSWSGNTKDAAKYVAQKLGADEFEIFREKP